MQINVLDHGYVRFVEDYGYGDAHIPEAGIIEAARQSTQASFRSWDGYRLCEQCGGYIVDNGFEFGLVSDCVHSWKNFPRGDEGLLSFLFNGKPQHSTPFEFAGMVIEVQAPIFVFREWQRHRTQSYNEMSARYAPLPDLNYVPSIERLMRGIDLNNKQERGLDGAKILEIGDAIIYQTLLKKEYTADQEFYAWALEHGVPKELARCHLPVGRYSKMRASTCLRNWIGFMTLRSDSKAQFEIQEYSNAVGTIIQERFPKTWKLFELNRQK